MASGGGGTPKTGGGEETGAPEDYEPEVVFTPVIPLPDKIEVVTGEEEEEVLLEDKAKLYRWEAATKEWKERGVGQAKLLRRRDSGKVMEGQSDLTFIQILFVRCVS
jgi:E3 SUMO-protein ligase RanBP2